MKTKEYSRFIIKLNYEWLASMVNLDGFTFDYKNFNDKVILEAMNIHKGTKTSLKLLGSILSNIEHSLQLVYFDKEDYPCKAEIIFEENDVCFEGEDGTEDYETWSEVKPIRYLIIQEAKETIKYYKEYFTRIYDRSRTV